MHSWYDRHSIHGNEAKEVVQIISDANSVS